MARARITTSPNALLSCATGTARPTTPEETPAGPTVHIKAGLSEPEVQPGFNENGCFHGGGERFRSFPGGCLETMLLDDVFHVCWSDDVVSVLADNFEVGNSVKKAKNQFDAQKALFRFGGKNAVR